MEYTTHFESFWMRYGADESLSTTAKGSKYKAQESWNKIGRQWASREHLDYDEQAFAQMVWRGYEAQKSNRRAMKGAKQFVPTLPHVTTWLNQWRFEQELDQSTGDLRRQAQQVHACEHAGCAEIVFGRSFHGGWICRTHDRQDWAARNRDDFRRLLSRYPRDADEGWREWSWRVMLQFDIGRDLLARMQARNPELQAAIQKNDDELRARHRAHIEEHLRQIREEQKIRREAAADEAAAVP